MTQQDHSFIQESEQGQILTIVLKPGSRKKGLKIGIEKKYLYVSVKAQPTKGKANKALVKYLKKILDISSSDIFLISGHTSQDKKILITNTEKETILNKLIK
jgi:hypothetical protein